jgi:hypothetical protein
MTSGHRHGGEKQASLLADQYYERTAALVDACTVVRTFDMPWAANRSKDGKRVYIDQHVPAILPITKIETGKTVPWHELGEWLGMNDGYVYDDAHNKIANPLERRAVEAQRPDDSDIWRKYSAEFDGYIRAIDDETITHVPADTDERPFTDDHEKKIIAELIAAGDTSASMGPRASRPLFDDREKKIIADRIAAGDTSASLRAGASSAPRKKMGFDPAEPRDEHGQWTSGGGPAHPDWMHGEEGATLADRVSEVPAQMHDSVDAIDAAKSNLEDASNHASEISDEEDVSLESTSKEYQDWEKQNNEALAAVADAAMALRHAIADHLDATKSVLDQVDTTIAQHAAENGVRPK